MAKITNKSTTKTITIYGIKNCDTMKKARAWLDKHDVVYAFHDYKSEGIDRDRLERWAGAVGWETLLNRAGTTFRKLPEKDKASVTEKRAIMLMLDQPSMIKRPVLEVKGEVIVGFKPETYDQALG
jgi:Spx/MgsR family transcriptional regulator